MLGRILLSVLIAISMAGCATGKKTVKEKDDLQTRVTELEEQLSEKDREIQDLESELENARKYSSGGNYTLDNYVSYGKMSAKEIQKALKNAGFYKGSIDGKIGKMTKRAVKDFQRSNGLTADGVVGKKTSAALRQYL